MAEEDVVAIPVQSSDHKRKLENLESEILEQHHEVSVDDGKNPSDYCQPKRPKLDDEAADGLGMSNSFQSMDFWWMKLEFSLVFVEAL